MGTSSQAAVVLSIALLLFLPAASGSWSEWRGSADNSALQAGEAPDQGVLRWKFDTGNQVLSSPVFYEGGMLIGSDDGSVYCLDPVTGEMIWKFKTKGEVQATPLISAGRAYFGSFDRNFYCINLPDEGAQPRKAWSYRCEGQIISSAHLIRDDLVFGDLNGTLYRLGQDGSFKWKTPIGNEIWASPLVVEGSGTIFVGDITGRFVSVDARSGSIERSVELEEYSESYSSPVIKDGIVYVTTGIGNSVVGLDAITLEERYRFECGYATYSTPVISGDRIYFGSFEYAWCLPLDDPDGNVTPEEVVWSFRTHDFQGGSSPLVMDDAVLIGSDNYRMYCLDRGTGEERYNFSTSGYIYSSPSYFDDAVFFGSSDWSVYSIGDPGSGQLGVEIGLDPSETTADSPVRVKVTVTDRTGAPVQGSEISIRCSAGDIAFSSDPPLTGPDGTLTADLDPFPVSSRSTLELTVTAKSLDRGGRAKATLIVEPGLEEDPGDPEIVSPYRIWYIIGIVIFLVVNVSLGVFLFILYGKAKEVR